MKRRILHILLSCFLATAFLSHGGLELFHDHAHPVSTSSSKASFVEKGNSCTICLLQLHPLLFVVGVISFLLVKKAWERGNEYFLYGHVADYFFPLKGRGPPTPIKAL